MYVCPSCLGMLIFCTRCVPAFLSGVHAASLAPRPSRPPVNIMYDYFYSAQKVGRSGRFCDVMMMSGGHGLIQHGRGLKEC